MWHRRVSDQFYSRVPFFLTFLALVFYEFLLTLDLEIRLVWRRKLRGATVIFLLNRYIILARYLFNVLSEHAPTQTVSPSSY